MCFVLTCVSIPLLWKLINIINVLYSKTMHGRHACDIDNSYLCMGYRMMQQSNIAANNS